MSEYTTMWEDVTLPSKGVIYDTPISPNMSIRSMTTAEEMKRLSPTDTPYKVMSDIIEDCLKKKPEMHVCNMAISDYQYLLHKLRIVTYGTDYKMFITCPQCGEVKEVVVDLDELELKEWDNSIDSQRLITLPVSNQTIELKFQTPRDLDLINYKNKERRKKTKINTDYSILFTLMSLIKTVQGRTLNETELEEYVKALPIKDANYILNQSNKLMNSIGLSTNINVTCPVCGYTFDAPFRITSEFFGPTED